jgi:hypothetical protein
MNGERSNNHNDVNSNTDDIGSGVKQYGLLLPVSSYQHDQSNFGADTRADSKVSDSIIDVVPLPRLVLRNLPYSQSQNSIQVKHNYNFIKIYKLIIHDWFHVLLRFPTSQSLFFLIFIWTIFLVIWSGMYVWVDRSNVGIDCGLGPNGNSISFRGAFAFSLQTSTTGMYFLSIFAHTHKI